MNLSLDAELRTKLQLNSHSPEQQRASLPLDSLQRQLDNLPKPRNPRYMSLDLWRGVACLAVVTQHSAEYLRRDVAMGLDHSLAARAVCFAGQGWLGVILFFVISGYCISATCDSTRRNKRNLLQYFRRRAKRILPPYWAALLCTVLFVTMISHLLGPHLLTDEFNPIPQPNSLGKLQWTGNLLLIEGWRSHVFGGTSRFQLGPAWTLCYEEQFYALAGLVLLFAPRRFFAGMTAITLLTLALMAAKRSIVGLFFDGNWFLFADGVVVYFILNYATRIQQALLAACLVGMAAACFLKYPLRTWQSDLFLAGPVIALLMLTLHPLDRSIAHAVISKPFQFCGTICYSLYLTHWPIVKFLSHMLYIHGFRSGSETLLLTIPTSVTASVLAGYAFHVAIERRFLNRNQVSRRTSSKETVFA